MKNKKFILASSSPRRKEILKLILDDFKVISPKVCEENINFLDPIEYVKNLAIQKGLKVKDFLLKSNDFDEQTYIISADTIIFFDNKIIGKPKNISDAENILNLISNKEHFVYTGFSIISKQNIFSDYSKSKVFMNDLTTFKEYLIKNHLDKAACYAIQDELAHKFIKNISGSFLGIVGLPEKCLTEIFNILNFKNNSTLLENLENTENFNSKNFENLNGKREIDDKNTQKHQENIKNRRNFEILKAEKINAKNLKNLENNKDLKNLENINNLKNLHLNILDKIDNFNYNFNNLDNEKIFNINDMRDEFFMRKVFDLAIKSDGKVFPNPMVGAIIIDENNNILGYGYHEKFGEAHAEVNAINSVKDKKLLENSTLFVNLEPCCHYGKTPPCTNLIIKSKIKNVIISNIDKNEKVAGKGIKILKDAGINVKVGVLKNIGEKLNKKFFDQF